MVLRVVKHSPPQSTSEGALWPQTYRKGRPTDIDYDQASKTKLAGTQPGGVPDCLWKSPVSQYSGSTHTQKHYGEEGENQR